MPLDLDAATVSATIAGTVGPRFFSSRLTGDGRAHRGILSASLRPAADRTLSGRAPSTGRIPALRGTRTQNQVTTTTIPVAPVTDRALRSAGDHSIAVPPASARVPITTSVADHEFSFALTPQTAVLTEDANHGPGRRDRQFTVIYRMELFILPAGAPDPRRVPLMSAGPLGWAEVAWSEDPMGEAAAFVERALGHDTALSWGNRDVLADWLDDEKGFNVHDAIAGCAACWASTGIADEVVAMVADASDPHSVPAGLFAELAYLENYDIPLEAYRAVDDAIEAFFDPDIVAVLARQNLNLLMSHTLSDLAGARSSLAAPPAPAGTPALPGWLSSQQRAAVTTREPLVMTTAGAGTGKSSVILERIGYLCSAGVDPSDITVISFTNAAADHITEKNPAVGSMTIAAMINDTYMLNHPAHQISSIPTIVNSLDIFFPANTLAGTLGRLLTDVDGNRVGATTALNNFIESHFDAVIGLLDAIGQTTLELEIIVCYQRIDQMNEPPAVACRHLIVDEVQDTSIFEFVYLLRYTMKHRQSLFIVGDASQTLYEFRAANPRALTALEGSGVFALHKLTTNYRSNQEILDFANRVLDTLSTNQLSRIQLRADSLAAPTADSFRSKVVLDTRFVPRMGTFVASELGGIIGSTVCRDYVDPRLEAGEQVAFIARTRREVGVIETELAARYPNRRIANITSDRASDLTLFSSYIKHYWNDVIVSRPDQAAFVVDQGVKDHMDRLVRGSLSPARRKACLRFLSDWWLSNARSIQAWSAMAMGGSMTWKAFFDRLRSTMLDHEASANTTHQNLVSQRNRARKQANAAERPDLIVSTVHGVKGLEFDHVVVVHKEDDGKADEKRRQEELRLFYVALTRAVKSEYVLSYSGLRDSGLQADYDLIVDTLEKADATRAAACGPDAPDAPAPDETVVEAVG